MPILRSTSSDRSKASRTGGSRRLGHVADDTEAEAPTDDLARLVAERPAGGRGIARVGAGDRVEHEAAVVRRRASGPSLSSVQQSAIAPCRLTRPYVGRSPVTPQKAAGERIEPQVSEPIANGTRPAATAAPGAAGRAAAPAAAFHGVMPGSGERRVRLAVAHAAGQLDHRELGDEHRAGLAQAADHGRVVVEDLLLAAAPRPTSWACRRASRAGPWRRTGCRGAGPRQWPAAISASARARLGQRAIADERDDGVVARAQPLQPIEEHLGQRDRRHAALADRVGELTERTEDTGSSVVAERLEALERLVGVAQAHGAQRLGQPGHLVDAPPQRRELLGGEPLGVATADEGEEEIGLARVPPVTLIAPHRTLARRRAAGVLRPAEGRCRSGPGAVGATKSWYAAAKQHGNAMTGSA